MDRRFSFNQVRQDYILRSLSNIAPGITLLFGIAYVDGELIFREMSKSGDIVDMALPDKPYAYKIADRFRQKNSPYDWANPADIAFIHGTASEIDEDTRDIFSESDNRLLALRIKNHFDHQSDVYFLGFRTNLSNFGVSIVEKPLATDHKTIIGNLLFQSLQQIVGTYDQDLQVFRSFAGNVRAMSSKHEEDNRALMMIKENYGDSLVALCRSYIQELSSQFNKTFHLSEDALERIREYKGNLQTLKLILADAVSFVDQAYFEEDDLDLKIHGWDLNFTKFSHITEAADDVVRMDSKESKAIILLDKLERAALEVLRQQNPLTSANVGGAFPTPITAPAISDALKKNKKKILKVLEQYPEKWSTIRSQFRPLKNITESSVDHNMEALSS